MRSFYLFFILILNVQIAFSKILVQGHRGSRATHPENTLPAFKEAIDAGVDILEFDLAVTKDGHIVISHDPAINNKICLDKNGKKFKDLRIIYHMTLKEIKDYDCGSIVNPRLPKQKLIPKTKIPTLEELLKMASKYPKLRFNMETKIFPYYSSITPSPREFVKNILKTIKKYNLEKKVIIQSFDYRTLIEVKRQNKNIKIAQLVSDNLIDMVAVASNLNAEIISPNYKWITKKMVYRLQKKKIHVAVWTANTKEVWDRLIDMGVDSIITDFPRELISYLKNKGLR